MKRILLLGIFLIASMLFACAPKVMPVEERPSELAAPVTKTGWEAEWERLQKAAQKEGRLVIYGDQPPLGREAIQKGWREKFGLEAEFVAGRGAEVAEKLLRERRAGIFYADVYTGGATTATIRLKPEGVLAPLEQIIFLPEVVDERVWRGGLFYDDARRIAGGWGTVQPAIYINTELVKPGEVKSFDDLLDPKWKGKIVINDPTTTGTGQSTMSAILVLKGEGFIKKLVEQKPTIFRDQRMQVEWLARGKIPVTIGVDNSLAKEFKSAGAPIAPVLPDEGAHITTATGCVGLVDRAPRPNAARLYINWILTREAQDLWSRAADFASRRLDVAADHLEKERRTEPGKNYVLADEEWQLQAEQRMELFKEIFKPVIR